MFLRTSEKMHLGLGDVEPIVFGQQYCENAEILFAIFLSALLTQVS